ncbi:MAG: hypothetical protein HY756_10465 [Nitrospirae bacterium]|nr:hypothetical protein [Nitrospirota bacterium]
MIKQSGVRSQGSGVRKIIIFLAVFCFLVIGSFLLSPAHAGEYTFDISETEKKPYQIGGYAEFRPVLSGLDKDASLHKLKFYNRDEGSVIEEYNAKLQLEGSLEKGVAKLFIKTNTDYKKSYLGEDQKTTVYEGFLSIKPSSSLTIDIGKKTLRWGKGYAWSPVAFIDRPKDPDDPELSLEGFIVASADYIKTFQGPLKTLSFTPVLIPVYEHVNNNFGDVNNLNFAGKLYFLFYDMDIDFIILTGGSKTTRYGADFSRNLTTNFEIHGELAFIADYKKRFIDSNGNSLENVYDAKSYLIGIRYLTEEEATYILDFDILYFTPSITAIANVNDKSFSISPELLYTGITNLELRLKASFLSGERQSEYGEKQNDYRAELRARYYF